MNYIYSLVSRGRSFESSTVAVQDVVNSERHLFDGGRVLGRVEVGQALVRVLPGVGTRVRLLAGGQSLGGGLRCLLGVPRHVPEPVGGGGGQWDAWASRGLSTQPRETATGWRVDGRVANVRSCRLCVIVIRDWVAAVVHQEIGPCRMHLVAT